MTRWTPRQRMYVEWFRDGMRMAEVADAFRVPLYVVERAIRKALRQSGGTP